MLQTIRVLAKEATQFTVVGTDDVNTVQCMKAIRQLFWGAQIRHGLPDKQGSGFNTDV